MLLILIFVKLAAACIPTQFVTPTTTVPITTTNPVSTTTTTTTTTTEAPTTTTTVVPIPCNICTSPYNAGCQGMGVPSPTDWCAISGSFPIMFRRYPEETTADAQCVITFSCPAGTAAYLLTIVGELPANFGGTGTFSADCWDTGNFNTPGVWTYYFFAYGAAYDFSQIRCKNM
ncbi:DUF281 domain-containing protein [Caenorhabditis elegans]|uniref:DUF281 domain-containing protein n=1 Tax=Caenorhabditis elegans TaxID=6239 RepID=A5JYX2_CAEEL|nr:DUF281 domain-containing protein [Caenorhabditis elegans]CAN86623.1 DUF281 domain-containing protein [Caenorhabditis elegans]|eukprot:NP_001122969.1 Uncharacterized protein CELE_K02E2.8 [Caenorhabditis elegans]